MLESAANNRPDWISEADHGTDTVDALLAELGISREPLSKAIRAGVTERRRATSFEPTTSPGLRDWIGRVGALRDDLHATGWQPIDPANAPMARRPDGKVLLGVMQGDEGTGNLHSPLSSTYPKGVTIAKLTISNNSVNQPLPGLDELLGTAEVDAMKVWFLVTRFKNGEANGSGTVHAELSQPAPTSSGTNITEWAKRCCFSPFEFEPAIEPEPTEPLGVDVPVNWR
ncbi:hypothetical protein SAMN06265360_106260 [Haloechinothrix alba]|uniref:Uncharacterized protein n=1 Tax=Haloechinothrix alba TaxID=664784 RepID=A0A238WL15_9PSEU|nr:hypothetical protein [Haloechinothrix alba]SNR46944.1 hypothetical protein SAMN06265360_106260 [Haloechinothrix alba]